MTLTIITQYRGGSRLINEGIRDAINERRAELEAWATRPLSLEGIERMFKYSWYDPSEFAVIGYRVNDAFRVVGVAWAYPDRDSAWLGMMSPYISPKVPEPLQEEALTLTLAWGRRVIVRKGVRGVARIYLGFEGSTLHRLAGRVLRGAPYVYGYDSVLMRYSGEVKSSTLPEGYRVRAGTLSNRDLKGVTRVHNVAFSKYEFFTPWSVEDTRKFYEGEDVEFFVAETSSGEVVGFIDGKVFSALDGRLSASIMTLAVLPEHRGKGLAKALVTEFIKHLLKAGAPKNRIALLAAAGLEKMYSKLGFTTVRRNIYLELPHYY